MLFENVPASRWKFVVLFAFSMIAGAALTFQVYAMTRSRPAEFAVALLAVTPVVMFAMHEASLSAPPLTAYEAGISRAAAWVFAISIPIFTDEIGSSPAPWSSFRSRRLARTYCGSVGARPALRRGRPPAGRRT